MPPLRLVGFNSNKNPRQANQRSDSGDKKGNRDIVYYALQRNFCILDTKVLNCLSLEETQRIYHYILLNHDQFLTTYNTKKETSGSVLATEVKF